MRSSASIITISDSVTAGTREDASGDTAHSMLFETGFEKIDRVVVPDEVEAIKKAIVAACETSALVLTTGGTGLGPRDVTPEATRAVIDKEVPGVAEMLRAEGLKNTPMAALSRGIVGSRGTSLVVNLPGGVKAVKENIEALTSVLEHALELLVGHTDH